ncbi:xylulokinase [Paenibacillus lignilyticus]|uniref:Xylulokinase n=1 Tax=Paenibacillus lignilyticus TaxID=1172615 RepID=A0ABS5C9Q8_9BACL|nr:FGGY family carbohydrate kinase [Paenibacillus lignilyticus]MBP3962673.1 hypothetical protein [Paenibacillus lignilyticus]
MKELFIGLDIGTSGIRAVAYTANGVCINEARTGFATRYSSNGAAEQNPNDWLRGVKVVLKQLADRLGDNCRNIAGIGLTGQCPTYTMLSPEGEAANFAVIYQDNRAIQETEWLIRQFGLTCIRNRTGQSPTPFYLAPKIMSLLNEHPGVFDGWSVVQPRDLAGHYLTGVLGTDPTHAACSMLYDLHHNDWATDWQSELGLSVLEWPEILPSCSILGYLNPEIAQSVGMPSGIPVIVGAADSLCAAYGARAVVPGNLCDVTGTSTCLHVIVPKAAATEQMNVYPHIVPYTWCADAGLNTTGAAVQWLSKVASQPVEQLMESASTIAPGCEGLLFLPYLSNGERNDAGLMGGFVGLQLYHSAAHMARAVLEGTAFATQRRINALNEAGCCITRITLCGGGSSNTLWNQIKADVLQLQLKALSPADTTAYGAASIAAEVLGFPTLNGDNGFEEVHYEPSASTSNHYTVYEQAYARFCEAEQKLTSGRRAGHESN